ncbi:hypothetical protein [Hymenobacter daeguensis]
MTFKPQNTLLSQVSTTTRLLLVAGGILVAYDYICRAANIYFFWESGVVGWFLLLLGAISFLLNRIDAKSSQKTGAVIEKGIVFVLVFLLIIRLIVFGAFVFSDAFEAASTYLKTNEQVRSEVGPVSGVVLFSEGEVNTTINSEGEQGEGVLNLVAKGQNKYRQFELHLSKTPKANTWQVVEAKAIE